MKKTIGFLLTFMCGCALFIGAHVSTQTNDINMDDLIANIEFQGSDCDIIGGIPGGWDITIHSVCSWTCYSNPSGTIEYCPIAN